MAEHEHDAFEVDHEAMCRLVLNRFEGDVLLRQEVESWLDELGHAYEGIVCICAMERVCYCHCEQCMACEAWPHVSDEGIESAAGTEKETQNPKGQGRKRWPTSDVTPMPEPMEVEIVPGFKVKVLGTTGEPNKRRRRK